MDKYCLNCGINVTKANKSNAKTNSCPNCGLKQDPAYQPPFIKQNAEERKNFPKEYSSQIPTSFWKKTKL